MFIFYYFACSFQPIISLTLATLQLPYTHASSYSCLFNLHSNLQHLIFFFIYSFFFIQLKTFLLINTFQISDLIFAPWSFGFLCKCYGCVQNKGTFFFLCAYPLTCYFLNLFLFILLYIYSYIMKMWFSFSFPFTQYLIS